ncbi:MAG: TetR/AcrR family transcriptional regulator [Spirochaetales bacterium]|nr:TetR/AcrR family transcriptional regulator [Spirochaetales bacterium]
MDKKDEILKTALEIVSTNGIDALTINSLSSALGLSKASLYHYFTSKDEIISGMLERGHKNIMKNGFQLDLKGNGRDILEKAAEKWENMFLDEDNWHFLRVVFSLHLTVSEAQEEYRSLFLMLSSQASVIISSFNIKEERKRALIPLFSSALMMSLERILEDEESDFSTPLLGVLSLLS